MSECYFDYYVGLDLGQVNDYSAICVIEEPVWEPGHLAARDGWVSLSSLEPNRIHQLRGQNAHVGRPPYPPLLLRHLERLRGLSYGAVVARIGTLLATAPLAAASVCLVVDHTGVGRGVLDWLVAAGQRPLGVTITGGSEVHYDSGNDLVTCPKRDLVVATQAALQNGRLRIAAELEHAPTLVAELKSYRVKISVSGHDSYDARAGEHDDLVLAVALAVWWRDWLLAPTEAAHAAAGRARALT